MFCMRYHLWLGYGYSSLGQAVQDWYAQVGAMALLHLCPLSAMHMKQCRTGMHRGACHACGAIALLAVCLLLAMHRKEM
jgi:hypothetical protein